MSTLRELAGAYLEAAAALKLAIQDQEKSLDALPGGQRRAAERDLALLRQMLRETREVGDLVRHYYDPAYWRDERYIC
ncbi:hypothetical protein B5G43_16810 [Flavonifractor sp. An92]|uniref:hypothetical protein n=1 Tax=Flavonifractor sp. An92 TaxID=1965666 RepID=UPI000B36D2DC|nr:MULTISPECIES: hypothetical protein [unclassified Flavonifractor]OUN01855.1 hypothetical protein B5G43_16810 [Flavonifractor sp. An92]OUQ16686.1 hypothetical protein B5E80_18940 [Flavonifractor sp. An135]